MTALLFTIMSLGIIGLARYIIYAIIILIVFPFLVDYYLSNAGKFHYTFGFSPEMMNNLPTTVATDIHLNDCIICQEMIKLGDEIMILRCPGRHFYHSNCISEWLTRKFCCPLCKSYNII